MKSNAYSSRESKLEMDGKSKNKRCCHQSSSKIIIYLGKCLKKINGIKSHDNFTRFQEVFILDKENIVAKDGSVTCKIEIISKCFCYLRKNWDIEEDIELL